MTDGTTAPAEEPLAPTDGEPPTNAPADAAPELLADAAPELLVAEAAPDGESTEVSGS